MTDRRHNIPHKKHESRTTLVIKAVIIALIIVLVVLLVFLIVQSIALRRAKILSARESWMASLFKLHVRPSPADVVFVRPWMTFDYVDALFRIPSDYLKTQLQINDPHYPRITIGNYANENGLDTDVFLGNVEAALGKYLTMVGSSSTPIK